jgi:hypothetical protein
MSNAKGGRSSAGKDAESQQILEKLATLTERLDWHRKIGWAAMAGLLGGLLFLFGWVFLHMPTQIREQNSTEVKIAVDNGIKSLTEKLSATNERLAGISAIVDLLKLTLTKGIPAAMKESLQKDDPHTALNTIRALAEKARVGRVRVDPQELATVGNSVAQLRRSYPELVSSALRELVDYRSFLNLFYSPPTSTAQVIKSGLDVHFNAAALAGATQGQIGVLRMGDAVDISVSARFEPLGHTPRVKTSPAYLVVDGTGFRILLDGFFIKKSIIQNAQIEYSGGPVRLENVYFVNCVFKFGNSGQASGLETAVLNSSAVTFSS